MPEFTTQQFCNVEDDEQGEGYNVTVWTVTGNPTIVHQTYDRHLAVQLAAAIGAAALSWLRAAEDEAADNPDSVKSPPRPDEVPAPLGLDGPGFYFQRYSDGEWLGPYETIPALAKALDLSDYPGNGHIVEWDGEVCGAVPSLNPDDLQPDVQRDGLTTAERQHIEFYNSYGVPVQWFVGKRRDNGDIEVIGLGENFAWSLLLNGEQCNTSEATLGEFNTGIEI